MALILIGSSFVAGPFTAPFFEKEVRQLWVEWRIRWSLRRAIAAVL